LAANLVPGELAINTNDGKLYYENSSGVVTLLASTSGASGDVVGPASATDTAVALFDGTTGKLIKNSLVTVGSTGNTIISGTDNSNAMLRITQLGTGNALLVEDSTNPDSSPFVIDASGLVVQGYTAPLSFTAPAGSLTPTIQSISQASSLTQGIASTTHVTSANGPNIVLAKSRGASASAPTIVSSGDVTGNIVFDGYDGATYIPTAYISSFVDGTPGTNDMPGRLVFSTTADGASSPTERMRIDSSGNVGIGTSSPAAKLQVNDTTSASATSLIRMIGQNSYQYDIQSLTTSGSVVGARLGFFVNSGSGEFSWSTSSAERMRIDSSGNVGIGTTTPSAQLQVAGNSSTSALKVPNIEEVATVSATAATGTINYDITTQSVLFYTSNASANWTVNFRGSSGTSLNTLMQTGESISVTFLVTQGSTAYYNSSVQVDGTTSGVTTRWQGSAPTSGNASSLDSYTYVIIKTANATFTVLAAQTKFA
jgi:hypothetical protein